MKCRYTLHTPRDALSMGSIVVPFIQIVYRHVVVFPIKSRVRVFTAFSDSCSFVQIWLTTQMLDPVNNRFFWTGLNDQQQDGTYVWTDGTPINKDLV